MTITENNAQPTALYQWCAFASDLNLVPGQWPTVLPTNLGNGNNFYISEVTDGVTVYKQSLGCLVLRVYND